MKENLTATDLSICSMVSFHSEAREQVRVFKYIDS